MFSRGLLLLLAPFLISAQSVVSVHSGLIHFFEGSVSIDGQPLEPKFGKFYSVGQGSELRTGDGRAEVLLTPGVLLRVDQNSSVRMVSNRLTDTCVEFVGGAAALDSAHAAPGSPVTITYRTYRMRFTKPGLYRLDSAPAKLRVQDGEVEVSVKDRSVLVMSGEALPFSTTLAKFVDNGAGTPDALDQWANQRSAAVAASNASAAAVDNLTSELNNAQPGYYDYGVYPYPALTPGTYAGSIGYSSWGVNRPYSLYSVPGLGYGYIPLYLRVPAYRQVAPIHPGTYRPATTWHPIGRTSTPAISRPAPAAMPHPPVGRAAGHR